MLFLFFRHFYHFLGIIPFFWSDLTIYLLLSLFSLFLGPSYPFYDIILAFFIYYFSLFLHIYHPKQRQGLFLSFFKRLVVFYYLFSCVFVLLKIPSLRAFWRQNWLLMSSDLASGIRSDFGSPGCSGKLQGLILEALFGAKPQGQRLSF